MSKHPSDDAFKKWATGRHAHSLDAYPCECFRAGWAAACAGMVHEAELATLERERQLKDEYKEELAKALAGMDLFEKRLQHEVDSREAELAKAWEAGRADTIGVVFQHCQPGNGSLFAAIDDDAAALQPPGGKAK